MIAAVRVFAQQSEWILPRWVETPSLIGLAVVMLWSLIAGKLRLEREVRSAEDRAEEAMNAARGWREAYDLEVEARRSAEAAARYIMDTDNVVVSLIEALKRGDLE